MNEFITHITVYKYLLLYWKTSWSYTIHVLIIMSTQNLFHMIQLGLSAPSGHLNPGNK